MAIYVSGFRASSVVVITATGSDHAYVRSYLDRLLNAYIDYRKSIRKAISDTTLASISEQVERAERDLRAEQETLQTFQRSNNLPVIVAQQAVAVECLKRLNIQLADLELDNLHPKRTAASEAESASSRRVESQRDYLRNSIKEWEELITKASALKDEEERLKSNVQRSQNIFVRLEALVQSLAIERNTSENTLAILEGASPALRAYTCEQRMLTWAGIVTFSLGLALIGVTALIRNPRS